MDVPFNASNLTDDTVAILLPPETFANQTSPETNIVFSKFNTSELYPLFNKTFPQFAVASTVVSATVVGSEGRIASNITVILQLNITVIYSYCCSRLLTPHAKHLQDSQLPVCVFWNSSAAGTNCRCLLSKAVCHILLAYVQVVEGTGAVKAVRM